MSATLTVYTTPTCPPCKAALKRLDAEGIKYATIDLTVDSQALADLKEELKAPFVQTPLFRWKDELLNIGSLRTIIAESQ